MEYFGYGDSVRIGNREGYGGHGGGVHGGGFIGHGGGYGGHGGGYGGHGGYLYNRYPSYVYNTTPSYSNYYYYPFSPCTCSPYESVTSCTQRRNSYQCL